MKILEQVSKRMPASTTYIAGHAQRGLPVTAGRTASNGNATTSTGRLRTFDPESSRAGRGTRSCR